MKMKKIYLKEKITTIEKFKEKVNSWNIFQFNTNQKKISIRYEDELISSKEYKFWKIKGILIVKEFENNENFKDVLIDTEEEELFSLKYNVFWRDDLESLENSILRVLLEQNLIWINDIELKYEIWDVVYTKKDKFEIKHISFEKENWNIIYWNWYSFNCGESVILWKI